jgi:hypothetical protein
LACLSFKLAVHMTLSAQLLRPCMSQCRFTAFFFTSFFFPTRLNQENQPSTKPQGRKRARSKTTVPTTTRTTRASASRLNQTDHTLPNDDTSAHRTSKDSNSPQADTEMQHSQDMTNTLRQIDNSDTLRGQGICIVIS